MVDQMKLSWEGVAQDIIEVRLEHLIILSIHNLILQIALEERPMEIFAVSWITSPIMIDSTHPSIHSKHSIYI